MSIHQRWACEAYGKRPLPLQRASPAVTEPKSSPPATGMPGSRLESALINGERAPPVRIDDIRFFPARRPAPVAPVPEYAPG